MSSKHAIPCLHCKGTGYLHIETAAINRSGDIKCEWCDGSGHNDFSDDVLKFLEDVIIDDKAHQLASEVILRAMKKARSSIKKGKRV